MANGNYMPDLPSQGKGPPNFREIGEEDGYERCGNCIHFLDFRCEKYDDYPVLDITICDDFEPVDPAIAAALDDSPKPAV